MRKIRFESPSSALGVRAVTAALVLCLTGAASTPLGAASRLHPSEDGVHGNRAARLPSKEFASELWLLVARFDSGHRLFAEIVITNIGIGDRNAAVIGHLVGPDGEVRRFSKAKREGHWNLSGDRLRIDLGSILLDQHGPVQRFRVDRQGIAIDLRFLLDGAAGSTGSLVGPDHGFDLLQAAGRAEATLRYEGMENPVQLRGSVALTHRWMQQPEKRLALRRIEFFSPQSEFGVYFTEVTAPAGQSQRWLVVAHDERIVYESDAIEGSLEWSRPEGGADAMPERLHLRGPGLTGWIDVAPVLVRYDPLQELPAPIRWAVGLITHPRSLWSASPFEVTYRSETAGEPVRIAGTGITNVTFFEPMDSQVREFTGGVHAHRRSH